MLVDRIKSKLGEIIGNLVGSEPEDESEHFIKCGHCGQFFDGRDFGDVLYHVEPGHPPIQMN